MVVIVLECLCCCYCCCLSCCYWMCIRHMIFVVVVCMLLLMNVYYTHCCCCCLCSCWWICMRHLCYVVVYMLLILLNMYEAHLLCCCWWMCIRHIIIVVVYVVAIHECVWDTLVMVLLFICYYWRMCITHIVIVAVWMLLMNVYWTHCYCCLMMELVSLDETLIRVWVIWSMAWRLRVVAWKSTHETPLNQLKPNLHFPWSKTLIVVEEFCQLCNSKGEDFLRFLKARIQLGG